MDAFEELYAQYYRRIFALCYRMTRSQYEAEDLTHDIFVHVYKKIQSFRGQSALMTWLHRVTVNQVLMHFRRKSARPKEVSSDTDLIRIFLRFLLTRRYPTSCANRAGNGNCGITHRGIGLFCCCMTSRVTNTEKYQRSQEYQWARANLNCIRRGVNSGS